MIRVFLENLHLKFDCHLQERKLDYLLLHLTQFQLEKIYESLEDGKPLPAWAAPNVRKVQDIMNARGLGASSVAAAAMVQEAPCRKSRVS